MDNNNVQFNLLTHLQVEQGQVNFSIYYKHFLGADGAVQ